jgi:capsular exopolysaccharide synthesis family protein
MSHIDEALRKATGVGAPRPGDVLTLDHYPREARGPVAGDRLRADRLNREPLTGRPTSTQESAQPEFTIPPMASRQPPRFDPATAQKLVLGDRTPQILLEQYRRLAAALHDLQVERGLKTLMITSALAREGKTLTAINLALTLSESYARRVLLVDADLRRPSIHDVLGIANHAGLSEALAAERGAPAVVEVFPRLAVLPAGRPGSAPLAGLTSDRMSTLLQQCESRFDWVLIDTPPVGFLPDAQLLARLTRAVVFVIGAGRTPYAAVTRAVAEVGRDCVIGTVLNGVDEQAIPAKAYYDDYRRSVGPA